MSIINAKKSGHRFCAWCGVICSLGWLIGLSLAGFLPPHPPSMGASEIAEIYRSDSTRIIAGMIIMGFGSVLYLPWVAEITVRMKRMEGEFSPWSYTQLGMGSIFVWVFFLPIIVWICAAYRPDETPDIILQKMNDFGWIMFLNPVAIAFAQGVSIGIAILQNDSKSKIFPRWLGFFNIWAMVMFLPGALLPFFKSGVLAWNGLFALWLPLVVFVSWMCLMTHFLLKAIDSQWSTARQQGISGHDGKPGLEHSTPHSV